VTECNCGGLIGPHEKDDYCPERSDPSETLALRERIEDLIREHDDPELGGLACKGFCECFGVQTLRELLEPPPPKSNQ
jgi:hypothetical protein